MPFIKEEDQESFKKLRIPTFEVQVGLHEMLGHGSGRLIKPDSKFNSAKHGKTSYGQDETYSSKFGPLSSSWEECR